MFFCGDLVPQGLPFRKTSLVSWKVPRWCQCVARTENQCLHILWGVITCFCKVFIYCLKSVVLSHCLRFRFLWVLPHGETVVPWPHHRNCVHRSNLHLKILVQVVPRRVRKMPEVTLETGNEGLLIFHFDFDSFSFVIWLLYPSLCLSLITGMCQWVTTCNLCSDGVRPGVFCMLNKHTTNRSTFLVSKYQII